MQRAAPDNPGTLTIGEQWLRSRLEDQELTLRGLIARYSQAQDALVPPGPPLEWRGPAQVAYQFGLARLRAELDTAREQLVRALAETRRALDRVENRVG